MAERAQGREPSSESLDEMSAVALARVRSSDAVETPAGVSSKAIWAAHQKSGCADPFLKEKRESNALALSMYEGLKQDVADSEDPLLEACLLAVSGNIIDLGIQEGFDIHATLEKVRREGLARSNLGAFRALLDKNGPTGRNVQMLYICDNAGEILFDRILIETLLELYPELQITASVNSGPVLNDALLEDAETVGLTGVVEVIENGHGDLGTVLERVNERFQETFRRADVIVSKGQANYETLDDRDEPVFFLLKAKCEIIAERLGVKLYDAVAVTFAEQ